MSVYTSNNRELCCPLCGDVFVHVDSVRLATRPRGEDGVQVHVGLKNDGRLITDEAPAGLTVGQGRRHRIALIGWCESCSGRFSLVFTQHKGVTFVESVPLPEPDWDAFPRQAQTDTADAREDA